MKSCSHTCTCNNTPGYEIRRSGRVCGGGRPPPPTSDSKQGSPERRKLDLVCSPTAGSFSTQRVLQQRVLRIIVAIAVST